MKHTLLSRLLGARGLFHFPRRQHGTRGKLAVPVARAAAPLARAGIAAVEALEGRSYFSFVVDGTVFFDWNEDGFKDPGEPVMADRQISYAYTPVDGLGDPLPRVGMTARAGLASPITRAYVALTVDQSLMSGM